MFADHVEAVHLHGDAHLEREGFWAHDCVTPARSTDDAPKKLLDASSIGFPLQVLILVTTTAVTTALTAYGAVSSANSKQEAANAAIKTEIALILKGQVDQAKIEEYKTKLDDERSATTARAIEELKRRSEMIDLKVNNLRETVLTNQRR